MYTYRHVHAYVYIIYMYMHAVPTCTSTICVCIWLGLPHFPWIVNKLCVQYSIFSLPPREGVRLSHKTPGNVSRVAPIAPRSSKVARKRWSLTEIIEFSRTNQNGGTMGIWDTCIYLYQISNDCRCSKEGSNRCRTSISTMLVNLW